jgi:uncharacterized SAM-binding protein YcdF (DUF218 family)
LKRLSPKFRRIGVGALALFGAWVAAAWALDLHGRRHTGTGRYDAIVVLGARVRFGGSATGSLQRRTERAVELWRQGAAPRIVFTGASEGPRPSEASVAAEAARNLGMPESAQTLEDRSTNTLENARNSRELLGPVRVLVVTDTYHVLRAEIVFRREFPEADVVGVSNAAWPQLREALREVLALGAFLIAHPTAGS